MGRGGGGIKYLETFRDIGAFLWEGGGIKYLETFRDIGAVGGGGINHYETFQQVSIVVYGPVVSVPAYESCDPSSILARCNIFGSRKVNHETFRDIRSA